MKLQNKLVEFLTAADKKNWIFYLNPLAF